MCTCGPLLHYTLGLSFKQMTDKRNKQKKKNKVATYHILQTMHQKSSWNNVWFSQEQGFNTKQRDYSSYCFFFYNKMHISLWKCFSASLFSSKALGAKWKWQLSEIISF